MDDIRKGNIQMKGKKVIEQSYVPGYSGLRFSTQELLQDRNSKNQWGDRSFWVAAPILSVEQSATSCKKVELYH